MVPPAIEKAPQETLLLPPQSIRKTSKRVSTKQKKKSRLKVEKSVLKRQDDSTEETAVTEQLVADTDQALIKASLEKLDLLRDQVELQAADVMSDLQRVDADAAYQINRMRPTERETFTREMRLLNDDLNRLLKQIDENEMKIQRLGDALVREPS